MPAIQFIVWYNDRVKSLILVGLISSLVQAALYQKVIGGKYKGRFIGCELALDVYEPYVSFSTDLRKRYTVKEVENDELELYKLMVKNAFVPGYFSTEFSVYPVLVTSAYIRADHPNTYESMSFAGGELNVFESLSAEFTDPFAFSFFLGEIMDFRKQIFGKAPESGFGLMGYVLTIGPYSSFNNLIHKDYWFEIKWKIKGLKTFDKKERTWNLVMGYTFHENDEFLNTFNFEIYRSLKSRHKRIRFLENTEYHFEAKLSPEIQFSNLLSKQQFGFSVGIFYPLKKWFAKLSTGMKRQLYYEDNGNQLLNYQFFFVPTLTF